MVESISPRQAWETLQADAVARLVDVRTDAEWTYVGLPDLSAAGKQPVLVSWQLFPTMQVDGAFVDHLQEAGLTPDQPLYFICRTGSRSLTAAQVAERAGFTRTYNIAGGFEGPMDAAGHRGRIAGWKADGLPWRQG
jgi:rhodanese-related sulfurtransferase